jgi:hypothetical protein
LILAFLTSCSKNNTELNTYDKICKYLIEEKGINVEQDFIEFNLVVVFNGNCKSCTEENIKLIKEVSYNSKIPNLILLRKYDEFLEKEFENYDLIIFDEKDVLSSYGIYAFNDLYFQRSKGKVRHYKVDGSLIEL